MAQELILRFDVAQEDRVLSEAEAMTHKQLKIRLLGLVAVEHARKR